MLRPDSASDKSAATELKTMAMTNQMPAQIQSFLTIIQTIPKHKAGQEKPIFTASSPNSRC